MNDIEELQRERDMRVAAENERDALRDVLKSVEWQFQLDGSQQCICCKNIRNKGHNSVCRLALAMRTT